MVAPETSKPKPVPKTTSQSNKEVFGTQITKETITEDLGENWIDAKKPEGYKADERTC